MDKGKEKIDYYVKVAVVGDSEVGKTSLLSRACDDKFNPTYQQTIGVDFKIKKIQVENIKIKVQLWDMAGTQKLKNRNNQIFFKGAIAVILVYSITDSNSFSKIDDWLKQINQFATPNVAKFLVGNKIDMAVDRKIDTQAGSKLALVHNMKFTEVSARDGTWSKNLLGNKKNGMIFNFF